MNDKLKQIKELVELELNASVKVEDIENIKVKYLGKKGEITTILKTLGQMAPEDRKEAGSLINNLRQEVESIIEYKLKILKDSEIDKKITSEKIDISIDKSNEKIGNKHPLTVVLDDIKEIFIGMGYSIAEGPEVEYSKLNFDALNTPKDHPARDLQDTFYITEDIILRTQTSPVQARTMLIQEPPIKIIVPGRVYRSDNVDATHSPMFHQVEGLVVDKNITMSDLKGTLETFAKTYFGENTKIRLRPHHFPFTEPSAEVDVSCFVCAGIGCKVCKGEGWIEILGAGMVHPNVLAAAGIDSKIYSGFAFGMGLERIAMTKFDINDMRYLYENDVRFLKQF
ncbi:MAG: phenylalanine--tRNA ligase subunit alpha [Clostridia bacterium]|nr:phenylalanine--tRNA ligase subunit alpha [Clostridia bacterium]MDD4386679.1 phenylalanine--tRNA ligase subunit alpha [Clostridia bacterium]